MSATETLESRTLGGDGLDPLAQDDVTSPDDDDDFRDCGDGESATTASRFSTLLPSSCRRYGRMALTILFWYAVSNTIILTTKWLFTNHFPFPLTVTCVSNSTAGLWAAVITYCCCCVDGHDRRRHQPLPSRRTLTQYILPIGLCTGAEIACSNLALKRLSVSFGTILKGGGPIWTFAWGLALGVEEFGLPVFGCLFMMALGIVLASLGEGAEFQLAGFVLQLLSGCMGGLRWAMTHKLLLDDDGDGGGRGGNPNGNDDDDDRRGRRKKMSPLRAILYTSPTTALCVIPLALGFEAPSVASEAKVDSARELVLVVSTMLFVASLVFVLLMSEYWLVNATSSLALSVAGVFKELITIGGGLFFFSERLDLLNVIGFALCQVGILTYVRLRYDGDGAAAEEMTTDEPYAAVESSASAPANGLGEEGRFTQESFAAYESDDMELS